MHQTHTAVYNSLPQPSHRLWRGTIDVGDGLAGSVAGHGSAPSRARTSEEDATSADGLTEGGGSGPSQRLTGPFLRHDGQKRTLGTPLAWHSDVLRFRPFMRGRIATLRPRKFCSRHLREHAFPAKSSDLRRCSTRRDKLTDYHRKPFPSIPRHLRSRSLLWKVALFRGVTFDPSGCSPAAITRG